MPVGRAWLHDGGDRGEGRERQRQDSGGDQHDGPIRNPIEDTRQGQRSGDRAAPEGGEGQRDVALA